jgi:ferredoxin
MMAKVDPDTCVGCRLCVDACPEVFEMAGEVAVAKVNPVPPAFETSCRDAADGCPVSAISVGD